jgi:hypothetical protein
VQRHIRGSDLKTFIKQLQTRLELLGIRDLDNPGLITNPEPYTAYYYCTALGNKRSLESRVILTVCAPLGRTHTLWSQT